MELNKVYCGDCLEVMRKMEANSIDTIITDPPYGIGFMGKEWDNFKPDFIDEKMRKDSNRPPTRIARTQRSNAAGTYDLSLQGKAGFQKWMTEIAKEMLRITKPGGTMLIFGGTRTYHRLACAIEDAGWILKDCIMWIYSTGFPKATDLKKNLLKQCTCGNMEAYENRDERKIHSEEKPKYYLRLVSETNLQKKIPNKKTKGKVLQSELSEQNIQKQQSISTKNVWKGQSSLEGRCDIQTSKRELQRCKICQMSEKVVEDGEERWLCYGTPFGYGTETWSATPKDRSCASHRPQSEQQQDREPCTFCQQHTPQEIGEWNGWKSHGLKPAYEPILVAMKPNEGSYAQNALRWNVAGLNIDGARIPAKEDLSIERRGDRKLDTQKQGWGFKAVSRGNEGRFPANIILNEEAAKLLPNETSRFFKLIK